MKPYHVCSHCFNGHLNTIQWNFSGTRSECKTFIRRRGNHGFYFITQIQSMDKVRRLYGE